jgi:hypothetical protein
LATNLFRRASPSVPDERYLDEWTAVLSARVRTLE